MTLIGDMGAREMDIVKRAYLQAKSELPESATIFELHDKMILNMVRWIKLRVYARRDWPTREFGQYPKHREDSIRS